MFLLKGCNMRSLLEIDQSRHLWPYIQIARIDHWFKNVFMLLGVLLALFYEPALFTWTGALRVSVALLATCLVASSNYVLNEILDAPSDWKHPVKSLRPIPSGQVIVSWAYAEWVLLGVIGLAMA